MATKPLIILARHKYLLLVPLLVILPIAAALSFFNRKTAYASAATIWVQQPLFIPAAQQPGLNPYLSYAQNQANVLNELLATNAFADAVAKSAGLPRGDRAASTVRTGTSVYANGSFSVVVRHASKDPVEAQKIAQSIIDEFRAQYLANVQHDADLAAKFYQDQLPRDKQALDDARTALANYVQLHPTAPVSGTDPQYLTLQAAAVEAETTYERTLSNLQNVTTSSSSTLEAQTRSFKVVDKPEVPCCPQPPSKRSLLALPLAGLLLAISLSAGIYAFLLRTDNSIRVAEDLQALPGLVLLGTVPDVSAVKKRNWPKHFFRLAVTALGVSAQR